MTRQELLDEWLRRLEAPESVQFHRAMADADGPGRCCLGHACEAYIALGGQLEIRDGEKGGQGLRSYNGEYMTLPSSVIEALGLNSASGEYCLDCSHGGSNECLSHDNDSGLTLPEIARTIRARPRGLFKEEGEA